MALICAEPPTRETELPTLIAGRTPWLKRSDSRKIWPSVIEMTLVGMYADRSPAWVSMTGRAVRLPPPFFSLSFAARWTAQQERDLPIGGRVLRKVVVDAEGVLAVVAEVLPERAARVGGEIEQRRGLGGRGRDHDRVLHRAVVFERLDDLGDRRSLLADGHVDADDALALLVDDRVEGD